MKNLKKGAEQAVKNCMQIKSKDIVIIIGDKKSKKIGFALKKESDKLTKIPTKIFILETFGKRPIKRIPKEIANAVKKSTATFYIAEQKKGELNSLRRPVIKLGTKNKKSREAHMPDITEKIMRDGMCADYKKIQKVSKKLYKILKKAKKIQVITKKGTNLIAEFNARIKWIICDGNISKSPTKWSNLPDGEIFTCVKNINGNAIIDGSLGDYFGKYGVIAKNPLYVKIKNGRVIKITCKNKKLEKELKNYLKQDRNSNRIGEFALGTNLGLKKLIGNLLQDEKFPGVHIAIGHGYPEETGSKWNSKAHCDLIIQKTTIIVDGKTIMLEGKYII